MNKRGGCRNIYVHICKKEERAKVSALTPVCLRLTVCVGPLGWHRSECAGRSQGHMLSKRTHEGQRWVSK